MIEKTYKFVCDSGPFRLFAEFFKCILERSKTVVDLADLPSELVRVEDMVSAAGASEFGVVLYPSDAFLVFAATVASDFDFNIIKQSGHSSPPE